MWTCWWRFWSDRCVVVVLCVFLFVVLYIVRRCAQRTYCRPKLVEVVLYFMRWLNAHKLNDTIFITCNDIVFTIQIRAKKLSPPSSYICINRQKRSHPKAMKIKCDWIETPDLRWDCEATRRDTQPNQCRAYYVQLKWHAVRRFFDQRQFCVYRTLAILYLFISFSIWFGVCTHNMMCAKSGLAYATVC